MSDWPRSDLLHHRARTTPGRPAVIDGDADTSIDWTSLDTRVGRLATTLAPHVTAGDRVGVLLGTDPAFVQSFWAITRLGGVVVPLNPERPGPGLSSRVERADVTTLICRDTTIDTASDLPVDSLLCWGGDAAGATPFTPADSLTPPTTRSPTDEHVTMFTSGTTGDPKGVRLTTTNLLTNAIGAAIRLGIDPRDRWLDCLPTHHMGGLAPITHTALYGTTLVTQSTFDVDTTPQTIAEYDVTGVSMVPTMLHRLLAADWDPPPTLDTVLLGGAPAAQPLLDRALDHDIPVYPSYGLTETASQAATAPPDTVASDPDTVGRPLLVTEITIVDDDGRVCATGETGEIHVDGPTVTPAYLDPDTTTEAVTDHGLATGDLGSRDAAGNLTVHGRLDDRILTGGETVDPHTVIDTLESHDAIDTAAVVGVHDPEWGERVGALIVPADAASPTRDGLDAYCRAELANFERPRIVAFTDALPRTASGTIDRDAVRNRLTASTSEE